MTLQEFYKAVSQTFSQPRVEELYAAVTIMVVGGAWFYLKYFREHKKPGAAKEGESSKKQVEIVENKVFSKVFAGDTSENLESLKKNVDEAVEAYALGNRDRSLVQRLNEAYWNIFQYIIHGKFPENQEPTLSLDFTEHERRAIDFGYFSDNFANCIGGLEEKSFEEALIPCGRFEPPVKIHTFTSWLSENFRELIGDAEIERLMSRFNSFSEDIVRANQAKMDVLAERDRLIGDMIARHPSASPAGVSSFAEQTSKIEKICEIYAMMKYSIQTNLNVSREDIREVINIENNLNTTLRAKREQTVADFFGSDPRIGTIENVEDNYIQKEFELITLIAERGKVGGEIERVFKLREDASQKKKYDFVSANIKHLKDQCDYFTVKCEPQPLFFLTRRPAPGFVSQIITWLSKVLDADPRIFYNKKVRTLGMPSILLIPGVGNGCFYPDTNSLLIPVFPLRDVSESLMYALASYRWECDDTGGMRASFKNLGKNRTLQSSALYKLFLRDYFLYITKEKEKRRALESDVVAWFNTELAPRKSDDKKNYVRYFPERIVAVAEKTGNGEPENETLAPEAVEAVQPAPAAPEKPKDECQAAHEEITSAFGDNFKNRIVVLPTDKAGSFEIRFTGVSAEEVSSISELLRSVDKKGKEEPGKEEARRQSE